MSNEQFREISIMNKGVMKTNYELREDAAKEEKSFLLRVLAVILLDISWFVISRLIILKYVPVQLTWLLSVVLVIATIIYLVEKFKVVKKKNSLCNEYTIMCAGNNNIRSTL